MITPHHFLLAKIHSPLGQRRGRLRLADSFVSGSGHLLRYGRPPTAELPLWASWPVAVSCGVWLYSVQTDLKRPCCCCWLFCHLGQDGALKWTSSLSSWMVNERNPWFNACVPERSPSIFSQSTPRSIHKLIQPSALSNLAMEQVQKPCASRTRYSPTSTPLK